MTRNGWCVVKFQSAAYIHPSIHPSINQSINQSYIEEGLLFCPDLFVGDCVDDSLLSEVFVALSVYCKSILMNKYLL